MPRRTPDELKTYDASYYDRWYHDPRTRVTARTLVRRKAALAVAATEQLLEHPVRNVLDVGCGEAPWRGALLHLRPRLRYTGVDPSAWAARRWGESRGVLRGGLSDLESLPLRGPFDLVVCSDVLHYVPDAGVRRGVATMTGLARGLLWLEAFTSEDDFEGDVEGFRPRPASWYRSTFRRAGLVPLGLWLHASPAVAHRVAALERSG
ncbi:MAG: class I SAM-dependent methyltransferase [Holophagales bacterium]|nr:class I SAM-dependent methyltransferase [Holophagales bacterium]MBK9375737.1 class I SAM-dependent methyltransferase [Holophagales bacterium]